MFITLNIWFGFSSVLTGVVSLSCGIDQSSVDEVHVNKGFARIETYPWLGVLYYPYQQKRLTTAVVLVTKQMVVATALEIDKLPKKDFRKRARVVVGHNCSAWLGVGIRDYSYYPDYTRSTYSAIALIQLETDHVKMELRPICPPPEALQIQNQAFYAMVLSDDCDRSKVAIHEMKFVSTEECRTYYRRAQLDIDTLWPTYTACAKSVTGGECIWRSGAILVVKVGMRWSLLGFGVYGPGCEAPARFLDYGMYYEWVQRSVERVGRPAITKLAQNYVVLRRSLSNIQRFGPCDPGEALTELYSERVDITGARAGKYVLNLTIIGDIEYSCIVLRADYKDKIKDSKPTIRLKRYCAGQGDRTLCFSGVQFIQIHFFVEIYYELGVKYSVKAYGRPVMAIDSFRAHKYANRVSNLLPILMKYVEHRKKFKLHINDTKFSLYGKKQMIARAVTGFPTKAPPTTTTKEKRRSASPNIGI